MNVLTSAEKTFLDVFLHEATTSPFTGPATEALHRIGVEYGDIAHIAWAYDQEVPKKGFGWGHSAGNTPPLPWHSREVVLRRDAEIEDLSRLIQKTRREGHSLSDDSSEHV